MVTNRSRAYPRREGSGSLDRFRFRKSGKKRSFFDSSEGEVVFGFEGIGIKIKYLHIIKKKRSFFYGLRSKILSSIAQR